MDSTEALLRARPLVDDLAATLGWNRASAEDAVLEYLTAPTWPEEDPRWLHHVVEAIQQEVQEDRIDTAWPQCPHHGGHPLWLEAHTASELWWSCRRDGVRIAPLGELPGVHRDSGE